MWRAGVLLLAFLSLIDCRSCSCDINRNAVDEVNTLQRGSIQQYARELFYYRNENLGNCIHFPVRSMNRKFDKFIPEDVCCSQQRLSMQSRSTSFRRQAITSSSFGQTKVDLAGSHEVLLQTSSANSLSHRIFIGSTDLVHPAVVYSKNSFPRIEKSNWHDLHASRASPPLTASACRLLSISNSYSKRSSSILSSYLASARHACDNVHSSSSTLLSTSQSLSVFSKSISTKKATSPLPSTVVPPFPQPPNQSNEHSELVKTSTPVAASDYFISPDILPEDSPSSLIITRQAERDMPAQDAASLRALSKTNHFMPLMQGNQHADRKPRIRVTTALPSSQPPFVVASPKFQSTVRQSHSPLPERPSSDRITSVLASLQPLSASVPSYDIQSPMSSSQSFDSLERKSSRVLRSLYQSSVLSPHIRHAHKHKHKSSLHSASPSPANSFPKHISLGQFSDPFPALPPETHSKDSSANHTGNIPSGTSIPSSAQRKPVAGRAGVVMQPMSQVPKAAPPSIIPSRHHGKKRKKTMAASPMFVGPPPPQDCATLTCVEPLTNTPLASPCGCVLPMQIGILLGVAPYAFFPLVSELAAEIAAGTYLKQSQVRIMGANADNEYQEKTYVNVNLVPLEEKFDTTTALLTYERFWQKKVIINGTLFGDYQVTFVHYPGLPPPPPSPFVNGNVDGGANGNSSGISSEDPLGVDIRKRSEKLGGGTIAAVALSSSVAVVICLGAVCFMLLKCRNQGKPAPAVVPTITSSVTKRSGGGSILSSSMESSMSLSFVSSMATYTGSAKIFTLAELEKATDRFNSQNILGEGGFGRVYRGVLEDGTKLAVKVLRRDDQQGGREFMAEVEMLSRLHHRNLVKLTGICTEEHNRSLVYELIPNGSVESHLHDQDKETAPLDWDARMKIALGAARGLAYLHEDSNPRVIHRDFKSSNILLEDDFTPKVSDFGLAKVASDEGKGYISTRVMGTFGYVAPEYAMTGHLLVKSDVYSYGVVLLELLSGRKPVDMSQPHGQENLVTWARPLLTSKEGLEILVDPALNGSFSFDNMARVAAIASMCVQPEVSHRPFMGEVVQALKLVYNDSDTSNGGGSQNYSQEEDVPSSDNELKEDSDQKWWRSTQYVPDGTSFVTIDYDSGPLHGQDLDTDRPLSASALLSSSGRFVREPSGSFRRHSSSGPLRASRNKPWYRIRGLTGGSMSEHGLTSHFGTGLDTDALELWP